MHIHTPAPQNHRQKDHGAGTISTKTADAKVPKKTEMMPPSARYDPPGHDTREERHIHYAPKKICLVRNTHIKKKKPYIFFTTTKQRGIASLFLKNLSVYSCVEL